MPDPASLRPSRGRVAAPKILAVGVAFLDHVFAVDSLPAAGGKQLAYAQTTVGGGMAANAAVAVARLGGNASFWGRVGDDDIGREIVRRLARENVDVADLRCVAGARSPVSAIIVDRGGERQVTPYIDASLDADPSWLPLERIPEYAAVLADVRWADGGALVLAAARARSIPAVLDADTADTAITDRLAAVASHIVFSRAGLVRFSGMDDVSAAIHAVADRFTAFVAVTLGAEGCAWRSGRAIRRYSAPRVAAVDTLGAGDVFHGAFALAIAEGMPVENACAFANAAAALKCTRFGGIAGAPTRGEVYALMAKTKETS